MRKRYNAASSVSDPAVREAVEYLYSSASGPKTFGDTFRVGEVVDKNGDRVLVFQVKQASKGGRFQTLFVVSADGSVYAISYKAKTEAQMDALGWNPSEV
jgi:hypothetical protein